MAKNLPCGKKYSYGKCYGELILVDGSDCHVRLRCLVCGRVVKMSMSVLEFNVMLSKRKDD